MAEQVLQPLAMVEMVASQVAALVAAGVPYSVEQPVQAEQVEAAS